MSFYQSQEPYGGTDQSPGMMDRVRNISLGSVLVGAAVGLIVGLIIGWVIWPVQWTNAWPGDLSEEARAQYLATVAQVYAYYPDDRAAETARARLYDLEANIDEEIAAAQTYFAENPQRDSNVYITFLSELAAGLGVPTGAPALDGAAAAGAEATADATADGGFSWVRFIFSALLVLVLVGGGIYILSRLAANRRSKRSQPEDDFVSPPQDGYVGAQSGRQSSGSSYTSPAPDDYRFDQEPEDGITYASGTTVEEGQAYDDDTFFGDETSAGYSQSEPSGAAGYADPYTDQQSDYQQFARPGSSTQETYGQYSETRYADDPFGEDSVAAESVITEETVESPFLDDAPTAESSSRQTAGEAPVQTQPARISETYIAHYEAGMADFDQSFNINDPATDRYIGECGLGVNMKNGIADDSPDNVIALDVWLFDQRSDRTLGNQTRVLLSEYVVDQGLEEEYVRERPDGPAPIVAQPGTSFQLQGENLLLDCEILEADYTSSGQYTGIFQNLKLEMTVRNRD
jgi:hypothetical protein